MKGIDQAVQMHEWNNERKVIEATFIEKQHC